MSCYFAFLIHFLNLLRIHADLQPIRVLFVPNGLNSTSEKSLLAAVEFFNKNSELYGFYINVTTVTAYGFVDEELIPKLCEEYNLMVENAQPPHLLVDATLAGPTSEAIKAFAVAFGLPTVTTSFGHHNDLREWRELNEYQQNYLVQVLRPSDLFHTLIPQLTLRQQLSNAAILFDETLVLVHKFKSIFLNTGISFSFTPLKPKTLESDLRKLHSLFFVNFFVIGTVKTIRLVLKSASKLDYLTSKYSWFLLTRDTGDIGVACNTCSLLIGQPVVSHECKSRLERIFGSKMRPEVSLSFHFDLYAGALWSIGNILKTVNGDIGIYKTCEEYYSNKTAIIRKNVNLLGELKKKPLEPTCGSIQYISNGFSHTDYEIKLTLMKIQNHSISEKIEVGTWNAGLNNSITTKNAAHMNNFTSYATYRVIVIEEKPHVFKDENHPSGYNGYSIDLLDELAKRMKFRYNITAMEETGDPDENGKWSGLISQLMSDEVDMGLPIYVTAVRQEVIDFTVPITDLEGINILIKNVPVVDDLFIFVHVFDGEVWCCLMVAYFATSLLMWMFTNCKPWYYPSLDEKISNRKLRNKEIRIFTLSECLWFCLTSLTALGGEQAPYRYSSRFVAGTWYIFAFIITCTYTANLAAVSTTSRDQSSINSLTDLAQQYKMQFAPLNDSFEKDYFKNRAYIEKKLYKVWEKMSLNDSISDIEKAKLAVFEYPFPNEFSSIWQTMQDSGFPNSLEEGIERVRNSKSSREGFALIGNSGLLNYIAVTDCKLMVVGEEFALKPIAIALPNASPLRKDLDKHILEMVKERVTDELKEKWWTNNPEKMMCAEEVDATDGMSIHTMGGIFLLLFSGIFIAFGILCVDFLFLRMNVLSDEKYHKNKLKMSKSKKRSTKMNKKTRVDNITIKH